MPIYFLVDKILPENLGGVAVSKQKMNHNLTLLGSDIFSQYKDLIATKNFVSAIPCGRYILLITKTDEEDQTGMIFFDFRNNRISLENHLIKYQKFVNGEIYKTEIRNAFNLLEPNYGEVYNYAELTLESSALN